MSLKKKIVLSFIISAALIAFLAAFEYVNFHEIKKEIRYLEITDTVRSKSLQLRRHEKNFFLYGSAHADEEAASVRRYLGELDVILKDKPFSENINVHASLRDQVDQYRRTFDDIEASLKELVRRLENAKATYRAHSRFFPLIELTFYERPREASEFLEMAFSVPPRHKLVMGLRRLDAKITALRKTGEDIITTAKELDKGAREKAEFMIRMSQSAILIVFPLFLLIGVLTIFIISKNVVSRLRLLIDVVEKTGRGQFSHVDVPAQKHGNDEVGLLIGKFNEMEDQLAEREAELEKKSKELHQSKKLAAIGTLAAGVAHELNNPLNNIYTTAQRMIKKTGEENPQFVRKGLDDILGQAMRVKRIVGDLLEFARGREPHLRPVELRSLLSGVFKHISDQIDTAKVRLLLDLHPAEIVLYADQEQLEQVFINLFANAVDALAGEGELTVQAEEQINFVTIKVSDTGAGMSRETLEKVFEPFYTTKNRGTGLGLAIVFNIIQKHQGKIEVESVEGEGTTFTITLMKHASEKV